MLSQTSILMGASGNSRRVIDKTYSTSGNNTVLKSDIMSEFSWDGTTAIILNLTIDSGVILDSTAVSTPALKIDGFPSDSEINIENNGTIRGYGGAGGAGSSTGVGTTPASDGGTGGTALYTRNYIKLSNYGTIAAGGGGGGGGGSLWDGDSKSGVLLSGGDGGAGAGSQNSGVGGAGGSGSSAVGSGRTVTAGSGGNGGSLGNSGSPGQKPGDSNPGAGGNSGYYVDGSGYVTWLINGTKLGRSG